MLIDAGDDDWYDSITLCTALTQEHTPHTRHKAATAGRSSTLTDDGVLLLVVPVRVAGD